MIVEAVGISRGAVHRYLTEMDERGMLSYQGREIRTEAMMKIDWNNNRAAIVGDVACGIPKLAEENIEEYVSLPDSLFGSGPLFILRARGESMIGAGIRDGDKVVIRSQSFADEGDIVVALTGIRDAILTAFPEAEQQPLHRPYGMQHLEICAEYGHESFCQRSQKYLYRSRRSSCDG